MRIPDFATIPDVPGVYFFHAPRQAPLRSGRDKRGKGSDILYIGKAANLRTRLRSYFRDGAALEPAKRKMLKEATRVTWEVTDSPIAALILEAKLVKTKQPPYNVTLRDDKKYFYVGFTREGCGRVFLTHQPHAPGEAAVFIGPFTDGRAIKTTLRLLRKVFPYRTHKGYPRRCLQFDMGLCPVPPGIDPPSRQTITTCARNVRALKQILQGDADTLLRQLEREMKRDAREQHYEVAAGRRDEAAGLLRVLEHRHVLEDEQRHDLSAADIPTTIRGILPRNQQRTTNNQQPLQRIEGYDIANLADGKAATGSMVVFTRGVPDSDEYRQFRIKSVKGANDVAMLREVLRRRVRNDWPLPDLILIDGGRPQVNAVVTELKDWLARMGASAPAIIGLAKREEEIIIPGRTKPLKLKKSDPFLLLLMHVRDEAHRFARRYHHKLRDYR